MLARFYPSVLAGVTALVVALGRGHSSSSSSSGTDSFLLRGLIRRPIDPAQHKQHSAPSAEIQKLLLLPNSLLFVVAERLDVESVLAWPLDVGRCCLGVADFSDSSRD